MVNGERVGMSLVLFSGLVVKVKLSARTNMSSRHYAFYDRQGNSWAKFDLEKQNL